MKEKVVLAYSGGLDTTAIIPWLKENFDYEVICVCILLAAHKQLEELILDRDTLAFKKTVSDKYADLVYEGKWFCPLREALQAFIESTQDRITGEVKFKLYKGNIIKAGTTSPYTLYSESLASFTTGDLYDHHGEVGLPQSHHVRWQKICSAQRLCCLCETAAGGISCVKKTPLSRMKS